MTYEIGRYYKVSCVYGEWGRGTPSLAWWPVMGALHEDRDTIGFKEMHYHIDWRFVGRARIDEFAAAILGFANNPLARNYALPLVTWKRMNPNGFDKPVLRRRQCRRDHALPFDVRKIEWMPALEAQHRACKLAHGRVCPHRGYDLSNEPVVNGVVTCPLHGLRWNIDTGELAPRVHSHSQYCSK